jgi:hypothetical protein
VTILEIRRIENENALAFGFYWHRKYRRLEEATKKRGEKNTDKWNKTIKEMRG